MMGLITIKNVTYAFRDDVQDGHKYWAWDIKDDYTRGVTHKWNKFPKGILELFFLDKPPSTVTFIPTLN